MRQRESPDTKRCDFLTSVGLTVRTSQRATSYMLGLRSPAQTLGIAVNLSAHMWVLSRTDQRTASSGKAGYAFVEQLGLCLDN